MELVYLLGIACFFGCVYMIVSTLDELATEIEEDDTTKDE